MVDFCRCPYCDSKQTYARIKTGDIICRKCGRTFYNDTSIQKSTNTLIDLDSLNPQQQEEELERRRKKFWEEREKIIQNQFTKVKKDIETDSRYEQKQSTSTNLPDNLSFPENIGAVPIIYCPVCQKHRPFVKAIDDKWACERCGHLVDW